MFRILTRSQYFLLQNNQHKICHYPKILSTCKAISLVKIKLLLGILHVEPISVCMASPQRTTQ